MRQKGYIERLDDGALAITVDGIDHIISMSQTKAERRLRITQSDQPSLPPWDSPEADPLDA